ncbi:hypothetical protein ACWEHA_24365 [Amycolatopsis nivea]
MGDPELGRADEADPGGSAQNTVSGSAHGHVVQARNIGSLQISTTPCAPRKRRIGLLTAVTALIVLLSAGAVLAVSRAGWLPLADKQPAETPLAQALPPVSSSSAPKPSSASPAPPPPASSTPASLPPATSAPTTSAPARASHIIEAKLGPRIVNGPSCAYDELCFYRGAETVTARYDLPRTGDPVTCVTVSAGDPGFQSLVNGSQFGYLLYPQRGCQGTPARIAPGPDRHLHLTTTVFSYSSW